jgi:hypothetical protein
MSSSLESVEFESVKQVLKGFSGVKQEIKRVKDQLVALGIELDQAIHDIRQAENLARTRTLQEHSTEIAQGLFTIKNSPTDRVRASEVAFGIGERLDTLLND